MEQIIKKVYEDVKNHTELYSVDWIKNDGLPYWQELVDEYPQAQLIIEEQQQEEEEEQGFPFDEWNPSTDYVCDNCNNPVDNNDWCLECDAFVIVNKK